MKSDIKNQLELIHSEKLIHCAVSKANIIKCHDKSYKLINFSHCFSVSDDRFPPMFYLKYDMPDEKVDLIALDRILDKIES
jgi:hypothetical protein